MTHAHVVKELGRTARASWSACLDFLILHTPLWRLRGRRHTFAFLVHPRSDDFAGSDVYGSHDTYRQFPALRYLFWVLPASWATWIMYVFSYYLVPVTLSRIEVKSGSSTKVGGYLLTTSWTPGLLFVRSRKSKKTKEKRTKNLETLFRLANRRRVGHVGLGALLPALTHYGKDFAASPLDQRPTVSTGHAYTAYTIVELLATLVARRNADDSIARVAIVGAAGSTGKATLRMLKRHWPASAGIELTLVDVEQKRLDLQRLLHEAADSGRFAKVCVSTELSALQQVEYGVVVTNSLTSIIKPEHVHPGTVLIDDSQPRNTGPELAEHGCVVIDVLARINGLDCHFDFGFRSSDSGPADPSVTFTCLAEAALAAYAKIDGDLAVGEVTDKVIDKMLTIAEIGHVAGLIGPLPLFSFGKELSATEQHALLGTEPNVATSAAE